jgi:hypothetical protein
MLVNPGLAGRLGGVGGASLPFAINATATQIRDAINDPAAFGYSPHTLVRTDFQNWLTGGVAISGSVGAWTLTKSDALGSRAAFTNPTVPAGVLIATRLRVRAGTFSSVSFGTNATLWGKAGARIISGPGVLNTAPALMRVTGLDPVIPTDVVMYYLDPAANAFAYVYPGTEDPGGAGNTIIVEDVVSAIVTDTAKIPQFFPNVSAPVGPTAPGYLLPGLGGARLNASARSSVAMQQRSDGTYEYAAHNLLTNSEDFSSAGGWTNVSSGVAVVIANDAVAPNNATTADRITFGGLNTWWAKDSSAFNGGLTYVASMWVKVADGGADLTIDVIFYPTGAGGASQTVSVPVAGAWARVSATFTAVSIGSGASYVAIRSSTTRAIHVWGAQLNLGPTATAYVPTTTAAVYAPAVDWLSAQSAYGLRSEAAATNLFTWSAKKSDASWVKSAAAATVGVGVHACPISGSLEVLTLSDASASGIYQIVSGSNSTQYTTFVLFRPVAGQVVRFGLTNQNEGALYRIDYNCDTQLTSVNASVGFTGTSHSVVALGSTGWLVFTLTGTTPASGTTGIGQFLRIAFAGSLPVGHSQLETGSRASSPILTLGAAATRAADALVVPGSGWLSSTQGTLAADYVPSAAGTQLIVELDDATANERHSLTNDGIFTVVDGGASQAAVDGGTPTVAARNKIAASYAVDAFAVALNGGAVVTDTSGTLPTVNRMDVNALNGHLTRIRYIGRRLTDGQLRALTE